MDEIPLMEALMRLKRGRVLPPEETRRMVAQLESPSRPQGTSLSVAAPNWLVSQLELPSGERRISLGVLSPPDQRDALLQVVVQSGSVQLRVLLHLNVEAVRGLLLNANPAHQLSVILEIEHTTRVGFLSLPLPSDVEASLRQTMESLRNVPGDLSRVLKIGAMHTLPGSVPSFVDGKEVTDVVTVLVAGDIEDLGDEEVESLVHGQPKAAQSPLH